MSPRSEQLGRLKEFNPFASSSAGNPWEAKYPDVPSINERAFDGVCRLLEHKARDPLENVGGMVLGEVGSGKTHLIGRILAHTRHTGPPTSFAYIQPIEDPGQTYRYLLREVMINLLCPIEQGAGHTQIDRLVAQIIKEYLELGCKAKDATHLAMLLQCLRQDVTFALCVRIKGKDIGAEAMSYLLGACPELSRPFLKVLFQYRNASTRAAAIGWLKGELIDGDDAALLGISVNENVSDAALEHAALDVLRSIGVLLARYRRPLLVCFDRLENLDRDEKIHALGTMLEVLIDRIPGMLPVAFFRLQAWEERFSKKLNQHVTSRLETNRFELKACTIDQGLALIRARLAFAYGVPDLADLSPLNEDALKKTLKASLTPTPRTIITLTNKQLATILEADPPPAASPLDRLQEELEVQYQTILADFARYAADRERLRCALDLYLGNSSRQGGYLIRSARRGKDKRVDLVCRVEGAEGTSIPLAVIIDIERHHASVGASLKAGVAFLEHDPSARAVYVRDPRSPIPPPPRWQATNALLEKFQQRGGSVLDLSEQDAARWYALALLSYAVIEGDVTVIGANDRVRPISPEELGEFIQARLHDGRSAAFERLDRCVVGDLRCRRHQPAPEEASSSHAMEDLALRMVALLRPVPMMMMHSATLAEALSQSLGAVSVDEMLSVVSRCTDRFTTIQSKNGVLVMVKKDWVYAQD